MLKGVRVGGAACSVNIIYTLSFYFSKLKWRQEFSSVLLNNNVVFWKCTRSIPNSSWYAAEFFCSRHGHCHYICCVSIGKLQHVMSTAVTSELVLN